PLELQITGYILFFFAWIGEIVRFYASIFQGRARHIDLGENVLISDGNLRRSSTCRLGGIIGEPGQECTEEWRQFVRLELHQRQVEILVVGMQNDVGCYQFGVLRRSLMGRVVSSDSIKVRKHVVEVLMIGRT